MNAQPIIQITDLEFQYDGGEFRLRLPQLSVSAGQKVAMIGPSGTGKTTVLHLLAGIRTPLSGQIQVVDARIHELSDSDRRRFRIAHIGFVFQDFELLEYLNVLDNMLHPYRLNPALKLDTEVKQRAIALAQQLGIADKVKRSVKALSQGERQRVAICRALLPQPKVLLADEATGNLDPANKQRILDILFNYVDEHQATLLAVTHDYELLDRFDQVIDLKTAMTMTATANDATVEEKSK
ncbi:MAG: ATP-binding cassette domain-containing protein, partial [Cyanobacteria bacterium J06559_3]